MFTLIWLYNKHEWILGTKIQYQVVDRRITTTALGSGDTCARGKVERKGCRLSSLPRLASPLGASALAVASAERKSANKRTDETRAIYKSVQSFSLSSHATSFSVLENIGEWEIILVDYRQEVINLTDRRTTANTLTYEIRLFEGWNRNSRMEWNGGHVIIHRD